MIAANTSRRGLVLCALTMVMAFLLTALPAAPASAGAPPVPKHSGTVRRIVYDRSAQRVWLVKANQTVVATHLVSGHLHGTLPAVGRYRVRSKSRYSSSLDGSVTMEYMVRFVYGNTRWIGFHSIPRDRAGRLIQSHSKLGTPTSSGCIRQALRAAGRLYDFARIGTRVTVVP